MMQKRRKLVNNISSGPAQYECLIHGHFERALIGINIVKRTFIVVLFKMLGQSIFTFLHISNLPVDLM